LSRTNSKVITDEGCHDNIKKIKAHTHIGIQSNIEMKLTEMTERRDLLNVEY